MRKTILHKCGHVYRHSVYCSVVHAEVLTAKLPGFICPDCQKRAQIARWRYETGKD